MWSGLRNRGCPGGGAELAARMLPSAGVERTHTLRALRRRTGRIVSRPEPPRAGRPAVAQRRACFEDDLDKSVEGEGDQARAKQDKTCNGHSEEAFRSEFIPHGTPPITCPGSQRTTAPLHSQRVSCRTPDSAARCYFRETP